MQHVSPSLEERQLAVYGLIAKHKNLRQAASALGVSRMTLYRWLEGSTMPQTAWLAIQHLLEK